MGSQGIEEGTQEPKSHALVRQGSLYSLTLDEVQNQLGDLGKPLSSMNLDELLKSVWSVESNQGNNGSDFPNTSSHNNTQLGSASSLQNRDLSKKTVDEVWQDIQQGQNRIKNNNDVDRNAQQRQTTLGEMTLEDFLVKAGVVAESFPPGVGEKKNSSGPILGVDQVNALPQQSPWTHYQLPSINHHQQQNVMTVYMPGHPIGGTPIMDLVAYPETQITVSPTTLIGTLSDTPTPPGRKRVAPGVVVEKTVERRQKRMIKNRESAARSRARKQAYTNELEHKVSRLEEENERLKRQKEVEKVLPCVPLPEPKYQLRRTSSASF